MRLATRATSDYETLDRLTGERDPSKRTKGQDRAIHDCQAKRWPARGTDYEGLLGGLDHERC
jgi:hypothetical protein